MSTKTASKGRGSTAAGQALGFGLQYTRMTYLLLNSPEGSKVGFEVLDDVHVECPDGFMILEQSKSSLTGNPLANNSSDLWKSLANWIDIVEDNELDFLKTRLILYVSKHVHGPIATLFAKANTIESAEKAFDEARAILWCFPEDGSPPYCQAGKKTKIQVERFFSKPNIAKKVIYAFEIALSNESPGGDLIKSFNQIIPEKRFAIASYICGWTKNRVDELIRSKEKALIYQKEFLNELYSYNRKYTERSILRSIAPNPTESDEESLQMQMFVRQLELIDMPFEDRLEQIRKYFKSVWDRSQWSTDGVVHVDSFNELDEELNEEWKNTKRLVDIEHSSKSPIEKGQLLLYKCLSHKAKLENLVAPNHFIPGCFHLLADGPELNIGWHPEYKAKLKE